MELIFPLDTRFFSCHITHESFLFQQYLHTSSIYSSCEVDLTILVIILEDEDKEIKDLF